MATQGCAIIKDQVSWYETTMSLPLGTCQQRQGRDGSNGAVNDSKPHQCKAGTVRMEGSHGQAFIWRGLLTPEDRIFYKLIFKICTGSSPILLIYYLSQETEAKKKGSDSHLCSVSRAEGLNKVISC